MPFLVQNGSRLTAVESLEGVRSAGAVQVSYEWLADRADLRDISPGEITDPRHQRAVLSSFNMRDIAC